MIQVTNVYHTRGSNKKAKDLSAKKKLFKRVRMIHGKEGGTRLMVRGGGRGSRRRYYTSPKQGGAKGSTKGNTRGQESGHLKTHNRI